MNIDRSNIIKGTLRETLPRFFPNSLAYLSELNEYRIYAEMWHNKKNEEAKKRTEISEDNFKQTLHFGVQAYKKTVQEKKEHRKRKPDDIIRFDYYALANSVNYHANVYGEPMLRLSAIEQNYIFEEECGAYKNLKDRKDVQPGSSFHSDENIPNEFDIELGRLGLSKCEKSGKFHFEINTSSIDFPNTYQEQILKIVLGEDSFTEKLGLLHKVDRKQIRCVFEDPDYIKGKTIGGNIIPRLCIAEPFYETMVFDFARTLSDNEEVCLLGTQIEEEKQMDVRVTEFPAISEELSETSQFDTVA